jgi:hypothetical protein
MAEGVGGGQEGEGSGYVVEEVLNLGGPVWADCGDLENLGVSLQVLKNCPCSWCSSMAVRD